MILLLGIYLSGCLVAFIACFYYALWGKGEISVKELMAFAAFSLLSWFAALGLFIGVILDEYGDIVVIKSEEEQEEV